MSHTGSTRLYRNEGGRTLVDVTVTVEVQGRRRVRPIDDGFRTALLSSPPVAHFGLGEARTADRVEGVRPDGRRREIPGVPGGRIGVVFDPP